MTPFTTLVALAALSGTGDAVLLQFSSENCGPCRAMQPAVSRLISDGYPVQRIDVDRYPEVAKQFNIRGVPAFVLVEGEREIGRVVGATSYDRLAGMFAGAKQVVHQPTSLQPTQFRGPASPDQAARASSVRLKVEDSKGYGFGTGTIIDVHDQEALIVTCGHLFRESQGKGPITVDLFAPGATQPVEGHLIACDLDRDIALVSIRPGIAIAAAQVAPPGYTVRPRDPVFTIGCDKGADATARASQITAVNKYLGKPNFTAAGAPVDGRSGGGLFTADGLLIGVCNAADPADDEGLYAALASIHWQLDQIGQSEIYQRAANATQVAATNNAPMDASLTVPTMPAAYTQPAAPPALAATTPAPVMPIQMPTELPAVGTGEDTELVVIIRSKRNPTERSEIYVVDQATPELLTKIVHAARQGADQRALAAQNSLRDPQRISQRDPSRNQPVVRGQFGE